MNASRRAMAIWHGLLQSRLAGCLACALAFGGWALTTPVVGQQSDPDWQLVTKRAGWQPRDSQGELVYNDRLWIFGGWYNSFEAPPRDVWNSVDGKSWQRVTKQAAWKHSDLAMSVAFKNRMWFMGGWYNGRLPGHSASNQVWSSRDGIAWTQATAKAGWSPRLAAGLTVFRNQLWIIGGTENYYFGDRQSLKNDVWASSDGKQWTKMTANAPWAPRAYHQVVVLNDKMYVLGGGNYVPEYEAHNDVWSSSDGVRWTRETQAAPWHARLWFSAITYRDRIWVLGGWSNKPSKNWGDVWYSADGKQWHPWNAKTCWKARHEHSAFVLGDKLIVAGGHARPLSSEVWSLDVPKNYFAEP